MDSIIIFLIITKKIIVNIIVDIFLNLQDFISDNRSVDVTIFFKYNFCCEIWILPAFSFEL